MEIERCSKKIKYGTRSPHARVMHEHYIFILRYLYLYDLVLYYLLINKIFQVLHLMYYKIV